LIEIIVGLNVLPELAFGMMAFGATSVDTAGPVIYADGTIRTA